jgi:hypothetical protein
MDGRTFQSLFEGELGGAALGDVQANLLTLDVKATNARVGRWFAEVASVRVHASTRERPTSEAGTRAGGVAVVAHANLGARACALESCRMLRERGSSIRLLCMTRCWRLPRDLA